MKLVNYLWVPTKWLCRLMLVLLATPSELVLAAEPAPYLVSDFITQTAQSNSEKSEFIKLSPVEVKAQKYNASQISSSQVDEQDIAKLRPTTSDTTRLLENIAGVSVYGAGAISALPVIHGLADDRLRVQVDGMDVMSACPNHMNSG